MQRRHFVQALGAAAAGLHGAGHAQAALRLTVASPLPPAQIYVNEIQRTFLAGVDNDLKPAAQKVQWNVAFGGTLARIPAAMESVETGQTDVGYMSHLFEPQRLPLQNVWMNAPFGTDDLRITSDLAEALENAFPAMQKQWRDSNIVRLASVVLDNYVLVARFPVRSIADLRGRKVGGAGPNLQWLEGTGAVGVQVNVGTAYNDMKSGVFDALFLPTSFVASAKLHEVAPYLMRTDFGAIYGGQLVMNRASWERLPPPLQESFRRQAEAYRQAVVRRTAEVSADTFRIVQGAGGTVLDFDRGERARWAAAMPNIAQNWARAQDAKGLPGSDVLRFYMDGLRKAGVKPARDWDRA